MTRTQLLDFMRSQPLAVQASVAPSGTPQAAVVGIAVTDELEIVFDTLRTSRKAGNLRRNNRIALVIGGLRPGEERSVQCEALADEPGGDALTKLKDVYFAQFPDGRARESWPAITYIRCRPTWIRFSDYTGPSPRLVEFGIGELAGHR